MIKVIDTIQLEQLTLQARESERLRKNLNLHPDYADPCQRLFNAMEPGTYIRPHRHTDPPKSECFLGVRGKMALLLFDDEGHVTDVRLFGEETDVIAIEIEAGVWHSIVSLETGSVFFETKPGPYVALTDKDFAPWSPEEGASQVGRYLTELESVVRDSVARGE